jgi:hypothetical protein
MNQWLFYDLNTGLCNGWAQSLIEPVPPPGSGVIASDKGAGFDHVNFKVVNGRVRELTEKQKRQRFAPTIGEVKGIIAGCLAQSDRTQVPDFPISDEARQAWRVWRQELRDLSKRHETAAAMIRAFPADPNGENHVSHLLDRLAD